MIRKPERLVSGVKQGVDTSGVRLASGKGSNVKKPLGTSVLLPNEGVSPGHGGQRTRGGGMHQNTQDTPKIKATPGSTNVHQDGGFPKGRMNLSGGPGTTPWRF